MAGSRGHLAAWVAGISLLLCAAVPALPPATSATTATSAPVLGKTYPIAERDFLEVVQERLAAKQKDGTLDRMQRDGVALAQRHIENPTPLPGIRRATSAETHYYDPAVTAPQDVRDADGHVLVHAGTRVNPLDYMGLTEVLLFVDGQDPQQVAYADKYYRDSRKPVKVVLVGGPYMALMRTWKRPVYFDQGGYLTNRLGITQVPALVYQDKAQDTSLRVDTVMLPGGGKGGRP